MLLSFDNSGIFAGKSKSDTTLAANKNNAERICNKLGHNYFSAEVVKPLSYIIKIEINADFKSYTF